jgi:SNF2 family DNA or RNA helicase
MSPSDRLTHDRHFQARAFKVLTYHGTGRQIFAKLFPDYDIVITTYNSAALDYKHRKAALKGHCPQTLFSVSWHRIILDEGKHPY